MKQPNFQNLTQYNTYVQCVTIENRQSPFYVVNRVTLTGKKTTLNILLVPWIDNIAANIGIIPGLKIWQFSCTATTLFIILYHEQPTFGWFSCKNHSRFKVDNFPGWLWVMIFVWQISCMAVNFFWQISGMAVRSEIRLTIFLFFVLKLVDNFTIWQNYCNPS